MFHCKWKFKAFLFVLFCTQCGTREDVPPMGTVLFDNHGSRKKCFDQNDIALFSTRFKFQNLLPTKSDASMLNGDGLTAIVRYFYGINDVIEKMSKDDELLLLQQSFYDLLGR